MKYIEYIIVILLICGAGYYFFYMQKSSSDLLLDSFEGKVGVDSFHYGSSKGSTINATGTTKHSKCGFKSLQLEYNIKPDGYVFCSRGYGVYVRTDSNSWLKGRSGWSVDPGNIKWDDYEGISFQMYGQNKGEIDFYITDDKNEMWGYKIYDTFVGWREITIDFDEFEFRRDWQPDSAKKDRVLDFPLKSYTFQPKGLGEGILNFDCMKLKSVK